MTGKKKKKEAPVTALLLILVIVLAVVVGILAWLVFGQNKKESYSQNTGQATKEENLTEKMEMQEPETGSRSDTEAGSEAATGTEEKTGAEAKTESKTETGAESETETEAATGTEVETGTKAATGTETETESETEMESETEPVKKLVVAIDPGHQGSWVDMSDTEPNGPGSSEMKAKASTGTQGAFSGKAEYELNLEISLLLREELENRGYEVILTREDNDAAISNAERAQLAYEQGSDIYVRIHANGSDDSSVSGALAMVPSASNPYVGYLAEDSYLLAQCILDGYCEKASFQSLGIQYYDNMTGINWSKLPVMILEMGFMTNQSDDLRMADGSVQPLMAEGIADGIDRYFEEKGMKSKEVAPEEQAQVDAYLQQVDETCIGPAVAQGENWAVSVKNLKTGAEGNINGDMQMKSASVIKVFIMAAIYDRVCYPSSEERHITFAESYDGELKQLITDMITVSDNTAANTLIEGLGNGDASAGMEVVNQFCQENGYTSTVLGRKFLEENPSGDNYTSANDCMRLFESIYNGTCVGTEASAKMYEYLKNQTRVNKIPAGISDTSLSVANKTGELAGEYGDYVENDIGIITGPEEAYVLCVLSNSLQDNGTAINQIASISNMLFN